MKFPCLDLSIVISRTLVEEHHYGTSTVQVWKIVASDACGKNWEYYVCHCENTNPSANIYFDSSPYGLVQVQHPRAGDKPTGLRPQWMPDRQEQPRERSDKPRHPRLQYG